MKPVVFLDFDGVIVTRDSIVASIEDRRSRSTLRDRANQQIDPGLVENVSALCLSIGAQIVISSSWRGTSDEDRALLEDILWNLGLDTSIAVVGQTPHLGTERGREICAWLDRFRPGWERSSVLILDDDDDLEPLLDRWVKCSWIWGFGPEQLEQAKSMMR